MGRGDELVEILTAGLHQLRAAASVIQPDGCVARSRRKLEVPDQDDCTTLNP
jgi:hypothetical protein